MRAPPSTITLILLATLLVCAGRSSEAQQVRGVVRDSAGLQPIAGAVVALLDSAGRVAARTLADAQGHYRFALQGTAVRLRALRMGFQPRELPLPRPSGDDVTIDIALTPLATLLASMSVTATSVCPARVDRGQALALLERARDGLLATVVARETKPGVLRTVLYERVLDARDAHPVSQTVRMRGGTGSRPFFAAHPASTFVTDGFMQEDETGRSFDGPDADVLLDERFATTHCFRIQGADAQHPNQIGLAFDPAPGRDTVVDVSGVLWIDRAGPALRTLDFRYTGLEPAAQEAGSGGSLAFRAMPNGVVLVERWTIRTAALARPRAEARMSTGTLRSNQRDVVVTALRETGGQVVSASWPDGTEWKAAMGQVTGQVFALGSAQPLENVRVSMDGISDTTITSRDGAFMFSDVFPGPYVLRASDSSFSEFGLAKTKELRVDVQGGLPIAVTIELPSREQTLNETCDDERISDSTAVLLGRVTRGGDVPPGAGTTVNTQWSEIARVLAAGNPVGQLDSKGGASAMFRIARRSGRIDDKGRFEVCGVRRDQPITIQVALPGGETRTVIVRIPLDMSFLVVAIQFPKRIIGVYEMNGGAPVEGARVFDILTGRTAVTTSTGTASLAFLPEGGSIVRIAKLGYVTQTLMATISPKDTAPITIVLARSPATTLATIVTADSATHHTSPLLAGFEERRALGFGHFITEAELRKSDGRLLPNVLEAIPGLRMVVYKAGTYVASSRDQKDSRAPSFQQFNGRADRSNPDAVLAQGCWVSVYTDGMRTYDPIANSGANPPDFSQLDVHLFAGIEYYSGSATVPAQFNGSGNTCGTLLLWTRER